MFWNLFKSKAVVQSIPEFYTICYISDVSEKLSDSQIEEILENATIRNDTKGISGILIFSLNRFFQILEGPKDKLDILYPKIKSDSRHKDIFELFNKDLKKSYFKAYNSSFIATIDAEEIKQANNYLNNESDYPFAKKVVNLLNTFELSARL